MTRYLYLCLCVLLVTGANAQIKNAKLTLSAEMKEPSSSTISDFLGEDDHGYYVLRSKAKAFGAYSGNPYGYILESYDKSFKLLKAAEIEPQIQGEKLILITLHG
jgi:hypothetical protein